MNTKNLALIAAGLLLLIACTAVPVSAATYSYEYGTSISSSMVGDYTVATTRAVTYDTELACGWYYVQNGAPGTDYTLPSSEIPIGTYNLVTPCSEDSGLKENMAAQTLEITATSTTSPTPTPSPTTTPSGCSATYCYDLGDTLSSVGGYYGIALDIGAAPNVTLGAGFQRIGVNIYGQKCGDDTFPIGGPYSGITDTEEWPSAGGNTFACIDNGSYSPEGNDYYAIVSTTEFELSGVGKVLNNYWINAQEDNKFAVTCVGGGSSGTEATYSGQTPIDGDDGYSGEISSDVVPAPRGASIGTASYYSAGSGGVATYPHSPVSDTDFYVQTGKDLTHAIFAIHADGATENVKRGISLTPSSNSSICRATYGFVDSGDAKYDAATSCSNEIKSYQFGRGGDKGRWNEDMSKTAPTSGNSGGCLVEWSTKPNYFFVTVRDASNQSIIKNSSFQVSDGDLIDAYTNVYGSRLISSLLGVKLSGGSYTVIATAPGYRSNTTTFTYVTSEHPDEVVYLSTATGSANTSLYLPVNIVDATTGYNIANSQLSSIDEDNIWYNQTNAAGKFFVNGSGVGGATPFTSGYTVALRGNATGYVYNTIVVAVNSATSGVTQSVPLSPRSVTPIDGESTIIASAYNTVTTNSISGVSIKIGNVTKTTNSAGSATFTNVTAGTYSYTATKSGYSTVTSSVNAPSGQLVYLNIPMSSSSINPTVTTTTTAIPTTTPVYNPTTAANGSYTGFWAPLENGAAAAGATPNEMGFLLTGLFVFIGACIGGLKGDGSGPQGQGILIGGFGGFLLSGCFGFINAVLFIVVIVLFGVFLYFFFR